MASRNPRPHPPYEEIEESPYSSRPRRGAEGRDEQTYDFLPIHRPGNGKRSVAEQSHSPVLVQSGQVMRTGV